MITFTWQMLIQITSRLEITGNRSEGKRFQITQVLLLIWVGNSRSCQTYKQTRKQAPFLLDKHMCCLQRASDQHSYFLQWSPKPRATCLVLNTLGTENHPHIAKLLLREHSVRLLGMIKAWVIHSQPSYKKHELLDSGLWRLLLCRISSSNAIPDPPST